VSRAVIIDSERIAFLEELGFAFLREGEQKTAVTLLGIVLAWRVSPEVGPLPPSNVVDLRDWSKQI
jgi:hypothetical protein